MPQPSCIFLAGPNGSGKSSIYRKLQPAGDFINADDIAKELQDRTNSNGWPGLRTEAGRIAIQRIDALIEGRRDFVFETTLSGRHSLRVMRDAKAAGFHIGLVFVILDQPSRNIARVEHRVHDGGHHVPANEIVRRYERSLANLCDALRIADESVIIDNSPRVPLFLFEKGESLQIRDYDREIELHRRLIVIVDRAFSKDLERPTCGRL